MRLTAMEGSFPMSDDISADTSASTPTPKGDQVPLNTSPDAAKTPDVDMTDDETGWRIDAQGLDDPPEFFAGQPGTQRDQDWIAYLTGTNGDGTTRTSGQAPDAYPNPDAVQSTALKTIGYAESQQGTRYCWGGGNTVGPTQGEGDNGGDATHYHDSQYVGYDCEGLTRYAVYQATGQDIGEGTGNQLPVLEKTGLTVVPQTSGTVDTSTMQPGDILYYGPNGADHCAIYMGNGVTVETNQSGTPAHSQPADLNGSTDRPITVVRPNYT